MSVEKITENEVREVWNRILLQNTAGNYLAYGYSFLANYPEESTDNADKYHQKSLGYLILENMMTQVLSRPRAISTLKRIKPEEFEKQYEQIIGISPQPYTTDFFLKLIKNLGSEVSVETVKEDCNFQIFDPKIWSELLNGMQNLTSKGILDKEAVEYEKDSEWAQESIQALGSDLEGEYDKSLRSLDQDPRKIDDERVTKAIKQLEEMPKNPAAKDNFENLNKDYNLNLDIKGIVTGIEKAISDALSQLQRVQIEKSEGVENVSHEKTTKENQKTKLMDSISRYLENKYKTENHFEIQKQIVNTKKQIIFDTLKTLREGLLNNLVKLENSSMLGELIQTLEEYPNLLAPRTDPALLNDLIRTWGSLINSMHATMEVLSFVTAQLSTVEERYLSAKPTPSQLDNYYQYIHVVTDFIKNSQLKDQETRLKDLMRTSSSQELKTTFTLLTLSAENGQLKLSLLDKYVQRLNFLKTTYWITDEDPALGKLFEWIWPEQKYGTLDSCGIKPRALFGDVSPQATGKIGATLLKLSLESFMRNTQSLSQRLQTPQGISEVVKEVGGYLI